MEPQKVSYKSSCVGSDEVIVSGGGGRPRDLGRHAILRFFDLQCQVEGGGEYFTEKPLRICHRYAQIYDGLWCAPEYISHSGTEFPTSGSGILG